MSNKCEALVKCPIGEKRKVEVEKPRGEVVDAYGMKLFVGAWTMFVQMGVPRRRTEQVQEVLDH